MLRAMPAETASRTLTDLPPELLTRVVRMACDDPRSESTSPASLQPRVVKACKGLSRTCRTLREICLPFLFQYVQLRHDAERSSAELSTSRHASHVTSAFLPICNVPRGMTRACLQHAQRFGNLRRLGVISVDDRDRSTRRLERELYLDPSLDFDLFPPPLALAHLRDVLSRLTTLTLYDVENLATVAGFLHAAPHLECLGLDEGDLVGRPVEDSILVDRTPLIDALRSLRRLRHLILGPLRPATQYAVFAAVAADVVGVSNPLLSCPGLDIKLAPFDDGFQLAIVDALSARLQRLTLRRPGGPGRSGSSLEMWTGALSTALSDMTFPRLESLAADDLLDELDPRLLLSSSTFPAVRSLSIDGDTGPLYDPRINLIPLLDAFPSLLHLTLTTRIHIAADEPLLLPYATSAALVAYCRSRGISLLSNCVLRPTLSANDLSDVFALASLVRDRLDAKGEDGDEGMQRLVEAVEGLRRVAREYSGTA
ncbi:hypothetical protein JCM6882_002362 [Rhodosporidiobolus microsporus]